MTSRTYTIPFTYVWKAVMSLVSRSRWTVAGADEGQGVVRAHRRARILKGGDDVVVRISLDADAQTLVEVEATPTHRRPDLGGAGRRARRLLGDLDRALGARPDQILRG